MKWFCWWYKNKQHCDCPKNINFLFLLFIWLQECVIRLVSQSFLAVLHDCETLRCFHNISDLNMNDVNVNQNVCVCACVYIYCMYVGKCLFRGKTWFNFDKILYCASCIFNLFEYFYCFEQKLIVGTKKNFKYQNKLWNVNQQKNKAHWDRYIPQPRSSTPFFFNLVEMTYILSFVNYTEGAYMVKITGYELLWEQVKPSLL